MAVIGAFLNHKTRWFDEYAAKAAMAAAAAQASKDESDAKSKQPSVGDTYKKVVGF